MPAVAFAQIRIVALGVVTALSIAGCGGSTVQSPTDNGSGDAPTSTAIVVDSPTDTTEGPTAAIDGNSEDDAVEKDTTAAQDTVTTTTGVVSNSGTTTTISPPETTVAPTTTIAPPTTFEVITVEPSSGPPPIDTVEPNA